MWLHSIQANRVGILWMLLKFIRTVCGSSMLEVYLCYGYNQAKFNGIAIGQKNERQSSYFLIVITVKCNFFPIEYETRNDQ